MRSPASGRTGRYRATAPFQHGFPALAEFIDTQLRQARNFRGERIAVRYLCPPLHDRFSRYFATFSLASKLICGPP